MSADKAAPNGRAAFLVELAAQMQTRSSKQGRTQMQAHILLAIACVLRRGPMQARLEFKPRIAGLCG